MPHLDPDRGFRLGLALLAVVLLCVGCQRSEPHGKTASGPSAAYGDGSAILRQVRLIRAQDGDSFIARTAEGDRLTVRLSGIDAPERSQPFADVARRHLTRLLVERDIELRIVKSDVYDRIVAQVLVTEDAHQTDVGLAQLDAGLAWYFRRYARDLSGSDRARYDAAEADARRARRGLWSQRLPEAPWDFRQRRTAQP